MSKNVDTVQLVIAYIEDHLYEKLSLNKIADGVHYSSYHIHRMFMETVGMTIHAYTVRRKLSEAAKLLIYTDISIMEIAFISGYESQRAFSVIFKQMYKKTPNQYRRSAVFYPLQLRYHLYNQPINHQSNYDWEGCIRAATSADIVAWMQFVQLVIDGFPYLDEKEYATQLSSYIKGQQAFIMVDHHQIIGTMLWNQGTKYIDFLGVHPQYQKQPLMYAFLQRIMKTFDELHAISITTFREGDKADLGYREVLEALGFQGAKWLVEFGYPTQKMMMFTSKQAANMLSIHF